MSNKVWYQLADRVVRAGKMPFPVTDTMIEFFQALITEEEAELLTLFSKNSMNIDEIMEVAEGPREKVEELLENLMRKGFIAGTHSRTTGVKVYTLMPPFPGIIEFQMMRGKKDKESQKIAEYMEKLFAELRDGAQRNYDMMMSGAKTLPVPARVVPVNEVISDEPDMIIPSEDIDQIVDAQDKFALAHCYCRIEKDLTGRPCQVTDIRHNCLIFGKVAEFAVNYDFAQEITREKAKEVMREAENNGLVHKIFHSQLDMTRDIDGICSCCSCCCGIFRLFNEGAIPFHTVTYYLASVEPENCIACGTCEDKCPLDAIQIQDDLAVVDEEKCIGCGVCVHFCPEDPEGIKLLHTEQRKIFILPPRIAE